MHNHCGTTTFLYDTWLFTILGGHVTVGPYFDWVANGYGNLGTFPNLTTFGKGAYVHIFILYILNICTFGFSSSLLGKGELSRSKMAEDFAFSDFYENHDTFHKNLG